MELREMTNERNSRGDEGERDLRDRRDSAAFLGTMENRQRKRVCNQLVVKKKKRWREWRGTNIPKRFGKERREVESFFSRTGEGKDFCVVVVS